MWRSMREIIAAAEAAHQAGVKVVAISDMRRGRLATIADHLLVVASEGISFFQSVTAANSAVYGLLTGMEAAHPDRSRETIRRTPAALERPRHLLALGPGASNGRPSAPHPSELATSPRSIQ